MYESSVRFIQCPTVDIAKDYANGPIKIWQPSGRDVVLAMTILNWEAPPAPGDLFIVSWIDGYWQNVGKIDSSGNGSSLGFDAFTQKAPIASPIYVANTWDPTMSLPWEPITEYPVGRYITEVGHSWKVLDPGGLSGTQKPDFANAEPLVPVPDHEFSWEDGGVVSNPESGKVTIGLLVATLERG